MSFYSDLICPDDVWKSIHRNWRTHLCQHKHWMTQKHYFVSHKTHTVPGNPSASSRHRDPKAVAGTQHVNSQCHNTAKMNELVLLNITFDNRGQLHIDESSERCSLVTAVWNCDIYIQYTEIIHFLYTHSENIKHGRGGFPQWPTLVDTYFMVT